MGGKGGGGGGDGSDNGNNTQDKMEEEKKHGIKKQSSNRDHFLLLETERNSKINLSLSSPLSLFSLFLLSASTFCYRFQDEF